MQKCGKEIESTGGVCPNCGAENAAPVGEKKARRTSKGGKWVVIALTLVVVVGAVIGVAHYNSPESLAERYCEAIMTDPGKALKLYAVDADRVLDSDFNLSSKQNPDNSFSDTYYYSDTWGEYYENYRLWCQERLERIYGEYTVTAETRAVKDISLAKLKSQESTLIQVLESLNYFDADDISDAEIVNVKLKTKSPDKTDIEYFTVYTVKVNGVWRVIDISGEENTVNAVYNKHFADMVQKAIETSAVLAEAKDKAVKPMKDAKEEVTAIQKEIETYFDEVAKGNQEFNLTADNTKYIKSLQNLMNRLAALTSTYEKAVDSAEPITFAEPDYDLYSSEKAYLEYETNVFFSLYLRTAPFTSSSDS